MMIPIGASVASAKRG